MIALMQQFFLIPAFRRGILALQAADLPAFRRRVQPNQDQSTANGDEVTPEDDWLFQVFLCCADAANIRHFHDLMFVGG